MKKKEAIKPEEPDFIKCANGNYPILTNPKTIRAEQSRKLRDNIPELAEQLYRLKKSIPELKYTEFQDHLRNVLSGIIEKKCLHDSNSLRYFTELRKRQTLEYKVENGRLIEKWHDASEVYPYQLKNVIVSLIDFLSTGGKILRCGYCSDFFIPKINRKDVKACSDKCRYSLNNLKRYGSEEALKKHREYMRNYWETKKRLQLRRKEGRTEKEAEEIIRNKRRKSRYVNTQY